MDRMQIRRLDEVAEVTAGNPAPQDPGAFSSDGMPFVRMQDVGAAHTTRQLQTTVDRVTETAIQEYRLRRFPTGSLLIPKSGASVHLNHRALLVVDACVVSHLAVVIPNQEQLLPNFLYYWSLTYDPRHYAQVTSLPSLSISQIKTARIPVPQLAEQRRVVDILSRAEGIVRLRRRAAILGDAMIPSVFVDMFGNPATNPKKWPQRKIGEAIERADYGTSKKASADAVGVPVVRMGNVTYDGGLDVDDLKYVAFDDNELEKYRLRRGDILFNRTNSKDLVGKTGLWTVPFEAVAASYFIRVRVDNAVLLPMYLWAFMNSRHMKRRLFETARGAIGQANINAKELAAFLLPIPPLELQRNFEIQCESIQSIAAQARIALLKAEELFQSLLHRVFVSELNTGAT